MMETYVAYKIWIIYYLILRTKKFANTNSKWFLLPKCPNQHHVKNCLDNPQNSEMQWIDILTHYVLSWCIREEYASFDSLIVV